jgi:transposase
MDMELNMLTAHHLRKQGLKIRDIADHIGKSERTIYYYLSKQPCKSKRLIKNGKLDSFKPFIDTILQDDPTYNRVLLQERIKKQGYTGEISILRHYAREKSSELQQKIVLRFETEPGYQAQVDWMYLGMQNIKGKMQKVYGFVMVMGYSRKPFVLFTTTMNQSVLLACHIFAFIYFGGIPREILYDNMKTAFIYDEINKKWTPNKALLSFAHHYGFIPKRCRIRRPQTKGKVERFILYVRSNFIPRAKESHLRSLSDWNDAVMDWLKLIGDKELRDFKESRNTRFEKEASYLNKLPEIHYDCRETIDLVVSRESFITFKTNRYSVPPEYVGKTLTLKVHYFKKEASIYANSKNIREITLEEPGSHTTIYCKNDKEEIKKAWEKQNKSNDRPNKTKNMLSQLTMALETGKTSDYDTYFPTQGALCNQ